MDKKLYKTVDIFGNEEVVFIEKKKAKPVTLPMQTGRL